MTRENYMKFKFQFFCKHANHSCSCVVYGCFRATAAACRDCTAHEPAVVTVWPLQKKFADPCSGGLPGLGSGGLGLTLATPT